MPQSYLIALFIGLPIAELVLLLKLHGIVGLLPTITLVFFTGIAGAVLVRKQGLSTLSGIQMEMANGTLPAPKMIDGVMILIAGALLVTPGLISDLSGFLLLIPFVREKIRFWLKKKLEQKIRNGHVHVNVQRPHNVQ